MSGAAADRFMFDTTQFNHVLKRKISAESFAHLHVLTTHVQEAELLQTPEPELREALHAAFKGIVTGENAEVIPASSAAFDVEGAGFGQACWNDGSGNFEKMLNILRQLNHENGRTPSDPLNPIRDVLIAETAIKCGAILVSGDTNLREVVSRFGGRSMTAAQFQSAAAHDG